MLLLRSELAERLADELLERGDAAWNACKRFRARIGDGGIYGAAVGRAFCMGELQVRGRRARDGEPAFVHAVVMRCAEGHEVFGGVRAVL